MWDFLSTYSVGIVASLVVLWVIVSLLAYTGLFHRVVVKKVRNPVGKLRVAYLYGTGPYRNVGPLFQRVTRLAPHARCVGVYYDDPKTTPENELRYMVGTILGEDNDQVDDDVEKRCKDDGLGVIEFPPMTEAAWADFPFRWMPSVFLAIWKVYSALDKKIKEEGWKARPCFEIYGGGMMNFYMPFDDHDEYYVPEALKNKST